MAADQNQDGFDVLKEVLQRQFAGVSRGRINDAKKPVTRFAGKNPVSPIL